MNDHTLTDQHPAPDATLETRHQWLLWLVAAQVAVLYAPTALWLWDRWTMSVWHNGHGLLIAAVVVYLVGGELKAKRDLPLSSNPWGFVILVPAMVLHMLDAGLHTQLLSAAALFLSLPGLALLFLGAERTRAIVFPLVMLLFTLPIPLVFTESLHLALRHIATGGVAVLVPFFGIPIFTEGTIVVIPNGTLQIADACSGFSTLYASVTVACMVAYFCPDKRRRILVLVAAVPIAIGVNVVRVVLLTLLVHWFSLDVLKTSAHEISGLLTFVVALPIIFWLGNAPDTKK
ncbi:MAG: exosortase/archaeosortase family protein [Gammaproteobacteria bacterium]|nr:exosortase/archaeosortase family protein [Gammaproteobacteria bacterium]